MEKSKFVVPEETLADIRALQEQREELGLNESQFAALWLTMTHSKYSRVCAALDESAKDDPKRNYFLMVKDTDSLCLEIKTNLREVKAKRAARANIHIGDIVVLSYFKLVEQAIRECALMEKTRIIKFLGATGAGKTKLTDYLEARYGAKRCLADQSWKKNRYYMLLAMCGALGVRKFDNITDPKRLMDMIVEHLEGKSAILVIDEAEYFGPQSLDTLREIINRTRLIVVLACTPTGHKNWTKYHREQADHVASRTYRTIYFQEVEKDDVLALISPTWFENPEKSGFEIAKRASQFGFLGLVERVRQGMLPECKNSHMDVKKLLATALADMGRGGAL